MIGSYPLQALVQPTGDQGKAKSFLLTVTARLLGQAAGVRPGQALGEGLLNRSARAVTPCGRGRLLSPIYGTVNYAHDKAVPACVL